MNVHILPMAELDSIAKSLHYYYHDLASSAVLRDALVNFLVLHITGKKEVGELVVDDLATVYGDADEMIPDDDVLVSMLGAIGTFLQGFIDRYCSFKTVGALRITWVLSQGNMVFEVYFKEEANISKEPYDVVISIRREFMDIKDSNKVYLERSKLRRLAQVADNLIYELGNLELLESSKNGLPEDIRERAGELWRVWERAKANLARC